MEVIGPLRVASRRRRQRKGSRKEREVADPRGSRKSSRCTTSGSRAKEGRRWKEAAYRALYAAEQDSGAVQELCCDFLLLHSEELQSWFKNREIPEESRLELLEQMASYLRDNFAAIAKSKLSLEAEYGWMILALTLCGGEE